MRHLLDSWRQVSRRLKAAKSVALFLDFDGTLADLRARPEEVWLHPATRRVLLRLARLPWLRVWIISGRKRSDIREKIRVPRLKYLGLHGWDRSEKHSLSGASHAALSHAAEALAERLVQISGVWIEDKGATLALHYRAAEDNAVSEARKVMCGVIQPLAHHLRVVEGDHVWEVMPREVGGKGKAALSEWRAFRNSSLPIYLGNDGTDEPAFAALSGGVTVRVGPRRCTRARFRLGDPGEVREFLERLEAELA